MTKCPSADDVVVNCATNDADDDGDSILFLHFTGAVFSFQFSCTFRLVSGRTTFKFRSLPPSLSLSLLHTLYKIAKFVLSSATTANNSNIHVRAGKYLKFSVVISVLSRAASVAKVLFLMPANSMSEAS